MHDFLGAFSPHLPTTMTAWFHVLALAVAGFVKLYRGSVMRRRAIRIDTFGWSIIMFDYVFGSALVIGTVWAFYPQLHTEWFDILTTGALVGVAVWQGFMVHWAPNLRLDLAMQAQDDSLVDMDPQWDEGSIPYERRSGNDRRKTEMRLNRE